MNDSVLAELKAVVQQAVQPVQATIARRRRMREELLSHLISIFEEEAERLGEGPAAHQRARERFGDPRGLSKQLQQSVPRRDRWRSILERLGHQPGESVWHLAARHLVLTLGMYFAAVLLSLPIIVALEPVTSSVEGFRYDPAVILCVVPLIASASAALSLLLSPVPGRMAPFFCSRRLGRHSLLALCGLASLLIFCFAPAASVILLLMTRQATQQWRYRQEWA